MHNIRESESNGRSEHLTTFAGTSRLYRVDSHGSNQMGKICFKTLFSGSVLEQFFPVWFDPWKSSLYHPEVSANVVCTLYGPADLVSTILRSGVALR